MDRCYASSAIDEIANRGAGGLHVFFLRRSQHFLLITLQIHFSGRGPVDAGAIRVGWGASIVDGCRWGVGMSRIRVSIGNSATLRS